MKNKKGITISKEGNVIKGRPILKQSIDNYLDETEIKYSEIDTSSTETYGFKELITYREGVSSLGTDGENATALCIENFKTSVENNGGYYWHDSTSPSYRYQTYSMNSWYDYSFRLALYL